MRIGHAWVVAHVDWEPSRGAVHRAGDTWVALDPSIKQHALREGHDFSSVPLDGIALGAALTDGSHYDADTLTALEQDVLVSAHTQYVEDAHASLSAAELGNAPLDRLLPTALSSCAE